MRRVIPRFDERDLSAAMALAGLALLGYGVSLAVSTGAALALVGAVLFGLALWRLR